jgi:hypothetical protein
MEKKTFINLWRTSMTEQQRIVKELNALIFSGYTVGERKLPQHWIKKFTNPLKTLEALYEADMVSEAQLSFIENLEK